jgi:hypothetical protein
MQLEWPTELSLHVQRGNYDVNEYLLAPLANTRPDTTCCPKTQEAC